ncbi:MAG: fibronectin type III domain-containing protein, partial [Ilumatobacteraceae bacterium]
MPTGMAVVSSTDASVTCAWSDVPDENGYLIERSMDDVRWVQVGRVGADTTTFTDTGLEEFTRYAYRVSAVNNGGASVPSSLVTAETRLRAPEGFLATVLSGGRIDVTWVNRSSRETHYIVEQFDGSTNGWISLGNVPADAGGMVVTGLFAPSTTYQFRVRAVTAFWSWLGVTNASSEDVEVSVTTPAYPSPPAALTVASSTDSSVALVVNGSSGWSGYRIERSSDASTWTEVGHETDQSMTHIDTELVEGSRYMYRVIAVNEAGASAAGDAVTAHTRLRAPDEVRATVVSGGQIDFTWSDRSSHETQFVIEQFDGSVNAWLAVGNAPADSDRASLTGSFLPSATLQFRVRASALSWEWWGAVDVTSDEVLATVTTPAYPSVPTSLTVASATDSTVTLSVNDVSGWSGYRIERSVGSSPWTEVWDGATDTTIFTDAGLEEFTQYSYRVIALNAAGASAPSPVVAVQTKLRAPDGMVATVVHGARIDVGWGDRSSHETHYVVEQFDRVADAWVAVYHVPANRNSVSITGSFAPSTTYQFRVRAARWSWWWDSGNTSSEDVTASVSTPAYPSPPCSLTVVASTDSSATVSWNDVVGESGYRIERSGDSVTWTDVGRGAADMTTFTDTALEEGS